MRDADRSVNHEQLVRGYFDAEAERYGDERYGLDSRNCHQYSYLVRRERVLELLDESGGTVLDVGCGPGVYTAPLLEKGYAVWGCDLSPRMIDRAERQFPDEVRAGRVRLFVGDLDSIEAEDGHFDVALCIGVMAYVREIDPFLQRMGQLVKPGGYVLIQASKRISPKSLDEVIVTPFARTLRRWVTRRDREGHGMSLRRYHVGELNEACANHGLLPEACVHFDYTLPLMRSVAGGWNLAIARHLESGRRAILRRALAGDFIAKYRKAR